MIAFVDVDYRKDRVVAACVCAASWSDAAPTDEISVRSDDAPADYLPGQFYRRELPYLLEVLAKLRDRPSIVVIDGYVWLDEAKPGIGARLFDALDRSVAVVGVAKKPFRGATSALSILRGGSAEPLFVTAAGVDAREAAEAVRTMHGTYRIPTLLKRVDRLSRDSHVG